MPRTNYSRNSRRPNKNSSQTHQMQRRTLAVLERIARSEDQEVTRMSPDVPDAIPPRMPRQLTTQLIPISYAAPTISGTSTGPSFGSISFAFADVPGYQSWAQCWDAYKILYAIVDFNPASVGVTGTTTTNGQLYTVLDYDDSATPSSTTDLLQYSSRQVVTAPQYFRRVLIPRCGNALYSGTFTSYGQVEDQWVDCDSPSVRHYGIKYAQTATSSAVTTYAPLVTLYFQFRNSL